PNHHQHEQAATIFANLDNPGKALRIITATQPIALATPPVVKVLQDLFPNECSFSPPKRSSRDASASAKELYLSADPFIIKQIFDTDNIRDSLRQSPLTCLQPFFSLNWMTPPTIFPTPTSQYSHHWSPKSWKVT
ncbi:MAG: hypothetical protein ACREOZ_01825, partial [Gloeomargaritales cyanobacterium]